jgi:arsenite-transporting ATPase
MSDTPKLEQDRRRFRRQETGLLHLSVTLRQDEHEVAGEIVDLSTRGARVRFEGTTPSFSTHSEVTLGLSTSLDPEPLHLAAVVQWNSAEQPGASGPLEVGIEFSDSDEETSHELSAFLEIAHSAEDDLERSVIEAEPDQAVAAPELNPSPLSPLPAPIRSGDTMGRSAREVAEAAHAMTDLSHLIERRVVLITGKGGVGRTTIAVALAHVAAARGKRVLVADIGDPREGQCPLAFALGSRDLSMEPTDVAPGIQACHLWGRRGHELFFGSVLPFRSLVRVAVGSRFLRAFLEAGPSFQEMGVFYQLLTLLRAQRSDGQPEHELIIVDMPATGHALALTGLPRILLRLIPGGPIARLLKEGRAYLNNPELAAAWIVTLPEMLPVSEALELRDGLMETDMPVGGVVLNRLPENPFTPAEHQVVTKMLRQAPTYGDLTYRRISAAVAAYERLESAMRLPILSLPEHSLQGQALVQQLTHDIEQALRG